MEGLGLWISGMCFIGSRTFRPSGLDFRAKASGLGSLAYEVYDLNTRAS